MTDLTEGLAELRRKVSYVMRMVEADARKPPRRKKRYYVPGTRYYCSTLVPLTATKLFIRVAVFEERGVPHISTYLRPSAARYFCRCIQHEHGGDSS